MSKSVKFISKCPNLTILIEPYVINVVNNIPQHVRGKKVEFVTNEFVTDDKKIIDFLRKHKGFGVDFTEIEPQDLAV